MSRVAMPEVFVTSVLPRDDPVRGAGTRAQPHARSRSIAAAASVLVAPAPRDSPPPPRTGRACPAWRARGAGPLWDRRPPETWREPVGDGDATALAPGRSRWPRCRSRLRRVVRRAPGREGVRRAVGGRSRWWAFAPQPGGDLSIAGRTSTGVPVLAAADAARGLYVQDRDRNVPGVLANGNPVVWWGGTSRDGVRREVAPATRTTGGCGPRGDSRGLSVVVADHVLEVPLVQLLPPPGRSVPVSGSRPRPAAHLGERGGTAGIRPRGRYRHVGFVFRYAVLTFRAITPVEWRARIWATDCGAGVLEGIPPATAEPPSGWCWA